MISLDKKSLQAKLGPRNALRSKLPNWQFLGLSPPKHAPVLGSTVEIKASEQPSNRYGVEWTNYHTPTEHLAFDFDLADSRARFTAIDPDDAAYTNPGGGLYPVPGPGGFRVPEAVGLVISSGVMLHDYKGFSSSLRLRYFGPRDLTSDGIYHSNSTALFNAQVAYQFNRRWRLSAEFLNVLNRRNSDIDYAYISRITPTADPAFTDVFHPTEPFLLRVALPFRFE
jgi:hypothetical protein